MVSSSLAGQRFSSLTFFSWALCACSKTRLQAMWYRVLPLLTSSRTSRSKVRSLTPTLWRRPIRLSGL